MLGQNNGKTVPRVCFEQAQEQKQYWKFSSVYQSRSRLRLGLVTGWFELDIFWPRLHISLAKVLSSLSDWFNPCLHCWVDLNFKVQGGKMCCVG